MLSSSVPVSRQALSHHSILKLFLRIASGHHVVGSAAADVCVAWAHPRLTNFELAVHVMTLMIHCEL